MHLLAIPATNGTSPTIEITIQAFPGIKPAKIKISPAIIREDLPVVLFIKVINFIEISFLYRYIPPMVYIYSCNRMARSLCPIAFLERQLGCEECWTDHCHDRPECEEGDLIFKA